MRPFYAILIALPLLMATACTSLKPGCIIEDKIVAAASDAVATHLQCANKFSVHQDISGLVKSLGLCKSQTGPIADTLCPIVSKEIVDKVVATAVPATWQCSALNAKATLGTALTNACRLLPLSWEPPQEK